MFFFELGLRHAAHKPVVLIKDSATTIEFNLNPLNHVPYNEDMAPRHINEDIKKIVEAIKSADKRFRDGEPPNKIMDIIDSKKNNIPSKKEQHNQILKELSSLKDFIDNALSKLAEKIDKISESEIESTPPDKTDENTQPEIKSDQSQNHPYSDDPTVNLVFEVNNEQWSIGDKIYLYGEYIGRFSEYNIGFVILENEDYVSKKHCISEFDYQFLSKFPPTQFDPFGNLG